MPNDQRGPFTIPSGKLRLRGIDYTFPTSQQGGVLLDDAAGNLSWGQHVGPFNALINGDFAFAQTGLTSSPLVNGQRNLDDWGWYQTGDGTLYQTRIDGQGAVIIGGLSLSTYTYINVITARTTSAAGDYYLLLQNIEGWDARHIVNGCAFSGWFNTTLAGTYCFAFRNRASTVSYVHPVTLSGSVWTPVSFVIPAMPTITGNMRDNVGISFTIGLAVGSTFQTTPDSWNAGNFFGTSAQTNFPATLSAQFYMHALNLVPGSVPQPFAAMPYPLALARVMRHRQILSDASTQIVGVGELVSTSAAYFPYRNVVEMTTTPSLIVSAVNSFGIWSANGSLATATSINLADLSPRNGAIAVGILPVPGYAAGQATFLQQQAAGNMYLEALPT